MAVKGVEKKENPGYFVVEEVCYMEPPMVERPVPEADKYEINLSYCVSSRKR